MMINYYKKKLKKDRKWEITIQSKLPKTNRKNGNIS